MTNSREDRVEAAEAAEATEITVVRGFRVPWCRTLKRAASLLAFALVVHLFVIPQLGGAREALSAVGSVDPYFLAAATGLYALALLVYARLTWLLLPAGVRPSLSIVFGTILASTGVNHVVPGGAATTAAVNYRLLGAAGVPRDALGVALGLQAIGSAVVLNAILWIALAISIPTRGFNPVFATAAGIGAILVLAFGAAVIALRCGRVRFADGLVRVLGKIPKVTDDRVRHGVETAAKQVDVLAEDRAKLMAVLSYAAANWLFDAAALWVALLAFGTSPGLVGLLVAYGLANVLAVLPLSPGGLGVVEAVLIPTLIGFGVPPAEAAVGVVAYRLISFWLPIPVGAVAYAVVTHTNGHMRHMRHEIDHQFEMQASAA